VDDSGFSIDLTIWGETAEKWNTGPNCVAAFKNLKVTDFSGRSLTAQRHTRWDIDPNIPRTLQLQNWLATQNLDNVQVLTRSATGTGPSPYKTLRDAKMEASGGKPVFFTVQATILLIKHDEQAPLYYMSCPTQGCNKKVVEDQQTGMWYCAKCSNSFRESNARYILNVKISDDTLSDFATVFDDAGIQLLGKKANEIRQMRENSDPELEFIIECAIQRRYIFKVKATKNRIKMR